MIVQGQSPARENDRAASAEGHSSFDELAALPNIALSLRDTGELNLITAVGLPGAENLDVAAHV